MTLSQYQRIAAFWDSDNDEVTQVALIICDMHNLSYDEVDTMEPKKFIKLSKQVERSFYKLDKKPFFSRMKFTTDATKINLGQFIEVQHFMKQGEIDAMHLISSSIWQDKRDHATKAEILLDINVRYVLKDFTLFLLSFSNLIKSYKGLFEVEQVEEEEEGKMEKPHSFIEQYGWIYSAKQIAEHEGISLDKAFELPILQAFNTLAYLKSFQSYQKYLNK
jgi:hypothetical protein